MAIWRAKLTFEQHQWTITRRLVVAGDFLHWFLKDRDEAALNAEHVEEIVPEGLLFRRVAA